MSSTCRFGGQRPSTTRFDRDDPCGSTGTIATRDGHESPVTTTSYKNGTLSSGSALVTIPPNPHTHARELEAGMRTFSIHGPYGMNISLSSALSGRLSVTFPHQTHRASSEPPPSTSTPSAHPVLRAAHSINVAINMPMDDTLSSNHTSARAPSPAPTEIEDPDPESILADIQALNIKVRDYAYPAPAPTPPATNTNTTPKPPKVHTPAPIVTPAVEIFDQYKGIAEFEYRLAQTPRTVPITGKTMRRLFELGWVTLEEAQARLHSIDWAALKEFDTRHGTGCGGKGKGKGVETKEYPWRPCKWSTVPTMEERGRLLIDRGSYFYGYDRVRRQLDYAAAREERERAQAEEVEERLKLRERERELAGGAGGMNLDPETGAGPSTKPPSSSVVSQPPLSPSRKRTFESSDASPDELTSTDPADCDAKRQRRSASPTITSNTSNAYPLPPTKQYPAPLSSYNPELYPEAASVIESQERPPLPRADTPPVRSDTPPLGEDGEPEHVGQPLVRRVRGLKRTLSRTQTFKQL